MQDQEMRALVRGFVRWLIRVGLALNLILWVSVALVYCQEAKPTPKREVVHSQKHKETIEQQDEIRFMFITVTDKNADQILFYRTGAKEVQVSFLFWDEQSVYKDPNAKAPYQFKGCFAALICLKHAYIYWLQRQPCSDDTGSFYFKDK